MACATAWISALLAQTAERPGRERLINVADESWNVAEHSTERYAGERVLKRAIGYVRVSSVGGRSGPGYHTLEIQRASIERTARFHQHELVEILTDEDRSGKTRNRPQFQVAMERLLAGDADAIVVWKVSRFSRNWREAAEDVETLLDHGKDLLSEEGFDTATAGGRLLLRILFSLANWEHDVLGEHWEVIKSKAVRDRGSHLGPAPLGYRHGLDGGVLEPDPDTAPLVVEMFERRAAGAPLSELVDMYDTAVPRSSGPRWRQDAERIISNRVYLGETRWRDEVRTDAHDALIGEDLWERANRMFAFEPPRRFKRPKSREFPLTGWLRCSGCGRTMGGSVFRGRHDNPIPTYCCNGRRRGCEHPQMVSAIAAEDWALGEAASMYSSLRVAADGQHDRELSDAVERVAEVAGALHDLASIEMRRSLGEDWLPMIQRLRADKTAAEHHADDVRRRSGVLLGRSLSWEDMDEADQWSALRRMAPAGAVVGPVVGYRDPVARLSFIVDEDELDTVPDLQEAQ
jgi:DNA invertase Pin-like site-specific DNA recombinase